MAHESWSLTTPGGPHEIEVDYGYWSGKATVRVDGRVVHTSRHFLSMGMDRGVDLPVSVEGRKVVVSIRPTLRGAMVVTGFRFGLSLDGIPVAGTAPVAPRVSESTGRSTGPRVIEMLAWASAGGGVIGLSQHGANPTAMLFLAAPAACSWVTRNTTLPTRVMALACLGIILAGIVVVALIGVAIKR